MAPEICNDDFSMSHDNKCDIYSLGIILFEMVNGTFPYTAKIGTPDYFKQVQ